MNKDLALDYINRHNIIEIKAGQHRTTFLEIWMVIVNDRIFARSWGLAEKSWYHTFLQDPIGQIKCGKEIFNIKAVVPDDITDLTPEINTAYLTKYNTGSNLRYSQGIIQQKHVEKTMEFIIWE
ncbi:DUF2255 family protein [Chryseobacterium carnipullorum]|uniref:DUF2255 family protein n=2 Tax=Chryseobacterium carnipullorum TaxID=1124835 RepID=A0A3G6NFP0_CHRCU|nr:DUF2255 family protein [Chryseobacterium carnipullorum]AZA50256.1 DUF2255 family protein [Chryseobacterium carnipullorum]AZA65128.1 DUF2255 family protein [Chryseobacterium carnipullorum]